MQHTINTKIIIKGKCLYSNNNSTVIFYPLKAYSGIWINNTYIHIKNLSKDNISKEYLTTINNIKLTEHILSALYYLNINNIYIQLENNEFPIFDGATKYLINNIKPHVKKLNYEQDVYYIDKLIEYKTEQTFNKKLNHCSSIRYISIKKGNFNIKATVIFPYAGKQEYLLDNLNNYEKEISNYKTFMNIEFYNYCLTNLKIKGASENNMLIFNENYNFEGTELVRHKILDIIGDIALLNIKIIGSIEAYLSGHEIHQELIKKIYIEYKNKKLKDTNIKEISYIEATNLIEKYNLKIYYGLNHFSFDLKLYKKIFLIEENSYYYIFPENPLDHWSPLCVYTNYHKEDSNYLPFYIKEIKNCILYKIEDTIREINPNNRYYWRTKCNLNNYLIFRDTISKKKCKHFPNTKIYNKIKENKDYILEIIDFNYDLFVKYYDSLKKSEHKSAKEIPIPNVDSNFIKLVFLKYHEEIIFIAPIIDNSSSVTILNLAVNLSHKTYKNIGVGNLACFKLFEYYCNKKYNSFDVGISKVYGCYKNKLFIERYQINEILDF